MKILRMLSLSVIMFMLVSLTTSSIISAQTLQEQRDQLQVKREEFKDLKAATVEERCSIATTRVDNLTTRYSENKLRYVNKYNNLLERLSNVKTKLEENEKDTTALTAHIDNLNTMIADFNGLIDTTNNQLNETKSLVCGESQGEYLSKLREAKVSLLAVRSKALEINTYFRTEVLVTLQELKASNS